jgi:signal transduction histidine kinase
MRLSTLVTWHVALFVALMVGSGVTVLLYLGRVADWQDRIGLARASYQEHLALESNIYQLLKQHGDALIIGDRDGGAMERALRSRVEGNLAAIRAVIAQEIELVGEEEHAELDALAAIERQVDDLTRIMMGLSVEGEPVDAARLRSQLVDLLDREIDAKLHLSIVETLEGEREEVEAAVAEAVAARERMRVAVVALTLAALGAAGLVSWRYWTDVIVPSRTLMAGVSRYEAGRFDHPVSPGGAWEFRQIGQVLSRMAAGLREREASQLQHQAQLEEAVQARTAELQRLLAQFERGEANRRRLMADISHELRTPLTIIQGEADVSLRGTLGSTEAYKEALVRIRDSARHTNRIVDDMLLIARQEAGQLRLDLKDVDLHEVVVEAAALMPGPVAIEAGFGRAVAKVDPLRLRQCLLAVFHNAQRYGGTQITARVEAAPSGHLIAVEDNGPGMSDAEKAQAFERFFRGSNASSDATGGNGLGLPIVRAIMQAHGGAATLADRPGGGLRVELALPASPRLGLVWDSAAAPVPDQRREPPLGAAR